LLPFCQWGANIFACVYCDAKEKIFIFREGDVHPQEYSLPRFFELWIEGVDLLLYDGTTEAADLTFKNPFTQKTQTTKVTRRKKQ